MTLERGTLLHKRYRIVDLPSQGGMGSVYRAIDENLGVEVAVKENFFTTDEYARQFRLEAVILANLRHPNLPRVTDHFVIGEQGQYLVMDYIPGEDLRQRMERLGMISEEEALLIGAAMCDALTYLHTRKPPVIHRDVKPGNVRVTPDGQIFLVDFGLAKVVMGSQATMTGARAMSPGYSPPEQYGSARTDPRTDIYSLGATLYAALTATLPEDGLARAMDNAELTPIRKHNLKVSRRMTAAIEKAMAVRAEERFQTAEEFKQALLSSSTRPQRLDGTIVIEPPPHVEGEGDIKEPPDKPITGKMVTPSQPPSQPLKPRRRAGCWLSISIVLLVILAVLAVFWSPIYTAIAPLPPSPTAVPLTRTAEIADTPTSLPPDETVTSTPRATPVTSPTQTSTPTGVPTLTATPVLTQTQTPEPTATPLGGGHGQIAFASGRSGAPQIFVMDVEGNPPAGGNHPQQVTNMADGACQPDWSPDGLRIVFISPCLERTDLYPGSSQFIINADGSGLTALPTVAGGDFDPAWSPDGGRIAFTSLRDGYSQIYVMNLADLIVTRLTETSSDIQARQPAWSPAGTQIVYTVRRLGVLQIWVMSDAGRGPTQLVRSGIDYWDYLPAWSPDGETILFSESGGQQALGWLMSIRYDERQDKDARLIQNGIYATDADYSPDGHWIVFESSDGVNYDIYLMGVDGKARARLTTDPALDFDPAWQPIGAP
jgi:Tol biopolymer transport system component/serine/threonine protein kinase